MPQTSPMSWMMISTLMLVTSTMMYNKKMNTNTPKKMNLNSMIKKWSW